MRHIDTPGYRHEALFYRGDEEFLEGTVPLVRDTIEADAAVLVAIPRSRANVMRDALGADRDRVAFADMEQLGRNPGRIIGAWRDFVREHAGGHAAPVGIGEPIWPGRSPAEVVAWKRMESGLNVLLAGTNIWMICPYDRRAAAPDVVAAATRTHPVRVDGCDVHDCPDYVDPPAFALACDADPLPDPPPDAARHGVDGDLRAPRRFLAAQAAAHGLTGEPASLLLVAAVEVVTEAIERGSGRATVSVWEEFGSLVVDVDDQAGGGAEELADPFAGYRQPGLDADPQDGLWLARQLCDAVDIRAGERRRTVRLRFPSRHAAEPLQP